MIKTSHTSAKELILLLLVLFFTQFSSNAQYINEIYNLTGNNILNTDLTINEDGYTVRGFSRIPNTAPNNVFFQFYDVDNQGVQQSYEARDFFYNFDASPTYSGRDSYVQSVLDADGNIFIERKDLSFGTGSVLNTGTITNNFPDAELYLTRMYTFENGDLAILGVATRGIEPDSEQTFFVIKTNSEFEVIFETEIERRNYDTAQHQMSVYKETPNGGLLFRTLIPNPDIPYPYDKGVVHIDGTGTVLSYVNLDAYLDFTSGTEELGTSYQLTDSAVDADGNTFIALNYRRPTHRGAEVFGVSSDNEVLFSLSMNDIFEINTADFLTRSSQIIHLNNGNLLLVGGVFNYEFSTFSEVLDFYYVELTSNGELVNSELITALNGYPLTLDELDDGTIVTSGIKNSAVWLYSFNPAGQTNNNADLDLTMTANNPQVGIYDYITITSTIQNIGTQDADNVTVNFDLPTGVAIAGEFPPNAEQGSHEGFYGGSTEGNWNVGNVPAGESLTFDVTFFTLSETPITFYGQVSAASGNDPDSTPDNGTCCTANEDDEAAYTFPNAGPGCTFDQAYAELICNDNETPDDANDDTYTLRFRADGSTGEYTLFIPELNYNQTSAYSIGFTELADLNLDIENLTLIFSDAAETDNCGETLTVTAPSCGGGGGGASVDLELSAANTPTPGIYAEANTQFTLENNSSGEDATGIQITFNKSDLNVIGVPTVSQGSIDLYWTDNPVWNVGNLAANQTATIDFGLFTLSEDYSLYGEVSLQDQDDFDSTPNNGNGTSPIEDDEAFYGTGGGSTPCNLSIADTQLTCAENTTNSPFVYAIEVAGAVGNTVDYEVLGTSFGGTIIVGQLVDVATLPQGTDFTIVITEPDNAVCDFALTSNIPVAPGLCGNGGGGADVTLDVSIGETTPTEIYQAGEAIFAITNTGTLPATGLTVTFSKNQVNVTGTPTTTAGTAQLHWTDNPVWQVGTLAPGQSENIIFPVFTVGENFSIYGEVTAMNEADSDSAPNNGNGIAAIEDDEALWPTGDSPNTELPDLVLTNVNLTINSLNIGGTIDYSFTIENQGDAPNMSDFVYTGFITDDFSVSTPYNAQGVELVTDIINPGESITRSGTFTLDESIPNGYHYFGIIIDGGGNIEESNEDNNLYVNGPYFFDSENFPCIVDIDLVNVSCSDTEGFYEFTINLTSQNPAPPLLFYTILNDEFLGVATAENGTYTFGDIPLSQGPSNLLIYDAAGSFDCEDMITIDLPVDCGLIVEDALTVDVEVLQNSVPIYSTFSATITVTNGTGEATEPTGVYIPDVEGFVFEGGNEFTATHGEFIYFNESWLLPSLAAGETAVLTLNYYTVQAGEKEIYACVNCFFPEISEDAATISVLNNFAGDIPVVFNSESTVLTAYPNPATDILTVEITSENMTVGHLEILDVTGRRQITQELAGYKGTQMAKVPVSELDKGIYILSVKKGEETVIQRFVKM